MSLENIARLITFRDTETNCEAATGSIEESRFAYATDTNRIGIYTNGSWTWIGSGSTWSVLTDGASNLIFGDGDVIMTETLR